MSDHWFTTWYRKAEAFITAFNDLGGELERVAFKFDPPIGSAQIAAIETAIKQPLSEQLKDILAGSTGSANMTYTWEPPEPLKPQLQAAFGKDYIYGGAPFIDGERIPAYFAEAQEFANNSWLEEPEFAKERRFWLSCVPFLSIQNGDYIAIDSRDDTVTYLAHDDESFTLAPTIRSFADCWAQIGYAGPESWILEDFQDPTTGLLMPPSSQQAQNIQRAFPQLQGA